MNFVKVGEQFINLDEVKRAVWYEKTKQLVLHFTGEKDDSHNKNGIAPDVQHYSGDEGQQLYDYLARNSEVLGTQQSMTQSIYITDSPSDN